MTEIERREYYDQKEREHIELVDCMTYAAIWLLIIAGLIFIGQKAHRDIDIFHFFSKALGSSLGAFFILL